MKSSSQIENAGDVRHVRGRSAPGGTQSREDAGVAAPKRRLAHACALDQTATAGSGVLHQGARAPVDSKAAEKAKATRKQTRPAARALAALALAIGLVGSLAGGTAHADVLVSNLDPHHEVDAMNVAESSHPTRA